MSSSILEAKALRSNFSYPGGAWWIWISATACKDCTGWQWRIVTMCHVVFIASVVNVGAIRFFCFAQIKLWCIDKGHYLLCAHFWKLCPVILSFIVQISRLHDISVCWLMPLRTFYSCQSCTYCFEFFVLCCATISAWMLCTAIIACVGTLACPACVRISRWCHSSFAFFMTHCYWVVERKESALDPGLYANSNRARRWKWVFIFK